MHSNFILMKHGITSPDSIVMDPLYEGLARGENDVLTEFGKF